MALMMMIRFTSRAVILGCVLALSACAAATPGYEPPNKRNQHRLTAGPPTGGLQPDGTYALSDEELKFDCKRLTGAAQIKILQLRHHALRPAPSTASRWISATSETVDRGVDTVLGKSPGRSLTADDYALQRAHLEALNRALASRNCGTFDLAVELKPEKGSTMPTPTGKK